MAGIRRTAEPLRGDRKILPHAVSVAIDDAERVLRLRLAGFGGGGVPAQGVLMMDRVVAGAPVVEMSELNGRGRKTQFGRLGQKVLGFDRIARHAVSRQIKHAEHHFRLGVVLFSGRFQPGLRLVEDP